jgi:hypothetical protein
MRQECWEEWIMSSPVGGGHAGLQAMTVCVGGVAARVLSTRSLVPDSDRQEWEGVRFNWGALPSVALRRVTGRGSKQERDCQSLRRKRRRDVNLHNRRADEAVEPCRWILYSFTRRREAQRWRSVKSHMAEVFGAREAVAVAQKPCFVPLLRAWLPSRAPASLSP